MLNLLVGLGIGVILGGVIGWLLAGRRSSSTPALSTDSQLLIDELRTRVTQSQTELTDTRAQLTDAKTKCATAEAERDAARLLVESQRELSDKAARDAKEAQQKALIDLREAFRALSAEALQKTQPEFLRLANETLAKFQESAKGDLKERQQAIATLVEPLKQHLETYQKRLQQSETAQSATLGEVKKQLETLAAQSQTLSTETFALRRVLSSNQARGRWGEETLRRVVESAGMSAHCDFSEQTQAGDGKPDLVVRLPGDRVIIVDSKVPDLDFLTAADAVDTTKRAEALAQHAAKLKATIKALAERDYPSQFANALDYVVLFLPAESLFSAALEGDQELMIWAQNRRILIATPCSLIAILRSVSLSWQQHAQTENARAIADAAQELFTRVVKFTEHFEKIRAGLERANSAFNDAVGSYERMVLPSGQRLLKLGGTDSRQELAEVAPLETSLRLAPTNN
ncbi:MAG TPA: DNA recombination protein RmuC [Methylomirabilota bacterium]|nr:DNA recombination protein RmuC [Methylomirabilota bacterium]